VGFENAQDARISNRFQHFITTSIICQLVKNVTLRPEENTISKHRRKERRILGNITERIEKKSLNKIGPIVKRINLSSPERKENIELRTEKNFVKR